MGNALEVKNLVKTYAEIGALNRVSFSIEKGEFFVIIGPSGCGKSTLLRCIAGILDWDEGDIYIEGESMRDVPAHKRKIALMPESFALFPHMRVYDNIAFGLRMHGWDEDEINREIKRVLSLVGMSGFERRWPNELSGGQMQRVSLARAIVIKPNILLLDEPLSRFDYRLQRKLMEDFKSIHRDMGNTWLLTSHVQEQALSMATSLMVMNSGKIEQIGPPKQVYERPKTVFAARFLGDINLLYGEVLGQSDQTCMVKTQVGTLGGLYPGRSELKGRKVAYGVRPEKIMVSDHEVKADNMVSAKLDDFYYFGELVEYIFRAKGGVEVKVRMRPGDYKVGETYTLYWSIQEGDILEKSSVVEGLNIEDVIYGR